jgi:membrane protein YdbS with pleckstrin-like domain
MLTVIRKSPFVIVRNLIALQFAGSALYFLAATLMDYAEQWQSLSFEAYVPFQVAQLAFIFLAEVVVLLYIFFLWYRETFHIDGESLVHDEGMLLRKHTVIARSRIASVTYDQNLFGRLTNYGTLDIRDNTGARLIRISHIPEPRTVIKQLTGRDSEDVQNRDPLRLVAEAEHEKLERKASFRVDVQTGKVNRALERAAMKTVAAFLNSDGGNLLLGVSDDGSAVGLERDFATLARRNEDGFENHFTNVLAAMLGPSFRSQVKVRHFRHEDKPCALVSVAPSSRPVYLVDDGKEEFYVRTGNGTTALRMSEAHAYIGTRFGQPS